MAQDQPYRGTEDFCLVHGYEHMRQQFGNPIPYCEACEAERTIVRCDQCDNGIEKAWEFCAWCGVALAASRETEESAWAKGYAACREAQRVELEWLRAEVKRLQPSDPFQHQAS